MIVVACSCGARLKATDEAAGRRIKCPRCNAKIPVPGASAVPAPEAAEPSPLDVLERLSSGSAVTPTPRSAPQKSQASDFLYDLADGQAVPTPPADPVAAVPIVGYAREMDAVRASARLGSAPRDIIHGPARGFWMDLLFAFAYPVVGGSNLINFAAIMVIAVISVALSYVGCLGIIAQFIIYGWMASIFMNVVGETAAGSDDLPGPKMEEGWYGDIIQPAFMFLGTFVVAFLPMIAYGVLAYSGTISHNPLLFLIWAAAGVFMWPMVMLVFSLGAQNMLFRPHLLILSIAHSILPYLAVWAALLVAVLVRIVFVLGSLLLMFGIDVRGFALSVGAGMMAAVAAEIVSTYLTLVSMRIVGLYYLHCKRRFAFKLE